MIAPNDPAILYSPYTWDVAAGRAKTINAGAYFRLIIKDAPSSVTLTFDMTGVAAPVPKVTYEVDGLALRTVDLAATITIPLPPETTWAQHLLTVTVEATSETVDRWNTQKSAVKLTGIDTAGTASVPAVRPRKALVLGDSITEGVRTLNATASVDTARNSSRNAWSHQLGTLLDAEIGVVGFGSTGFSRGGAGNAPAISGFWNKHWMDGPTRGVESAPPDYIVINMGTNDLDATDITALYISLLNAMLAATSGTHVFCMVPFEGSHSAEIRAATRGCSNPERCTFIDTAGWWSSADASDGLHPYGYVSPGLSRRVASKVTEATFATPAVNGFFFDLEGNPQPMSTTLLM